MSRKKMQAEEQATPIQSDPVRQALRNRNPYEFQERLCNPCVYWGDWGEMSDHEPCKFKQIPAPGHRCVLFDFGESEQTV